MQALFPPVQIGQIKSFGPVGTKYEVVKPLHPLEDGDWMIEVKMLDTEEHAEYRLSHINDDPEAH